MRRSFRLPWQASFVLLGAIWGSSFLFIKVGLEALTPLQVAFGRLAIGAVVLLALSAATRTGLPSDRATWRHLTVTALLFCSVPFTLFAYGETQISSILAGIVNAATPLATLVVVLLAFPEERPTPGRIAGLAIGFAGCLVVLGVWKGFGGGELVGILACVAAICCYGIAYPYTRRHLATGEGPLAIATGQVCLGAALLLPVVALELVVGYPAPGPLGVVPIAALLALGALGSGIAYLLNTQVVIAAGGTVGSSVTYVIPVVAVAVGSAFLGEPLGWNEPLGGLVILAGVAIAEGQAGRATGWLRRSIAG